MAALERFLIDDLPPRPDVKAAEIHRQLGPVPGAVAVEAVAASLGIEEIRRLASPGFEGLLVTDRERSSGAISVNGASSPRRQRFSLAHELGHYLCYWHETADSLFRCTKQDMTLPKGAVAHRLQEGEANAFAIELLAPATRFRSRLRRLPDLEHVLALAGELDLSRQATARRYVALHTRPVAVLFARDGVLGYLDRSPACPYLKLKPGHHLPDRPRPSSAGQPSELLDADGLDWGFSDDRALGVQTLRQGDGYEIVLLALDDDGSAD